MRFGAPSGPTRTATSPSWTRSSASTQASSAPRSRRGFANNRWSRSGLKPSELLLALLELRVRGFDVLDERLRRHPTDHQLLDVAVDRLAHLRSRPLEELQHG